MSEVVPGLAQARAMLGNIDSSKMIVGGVSVLVVLGAIYVISADQLAGGQVQLNPKQVSTNLARIGSVTLVKPPAPPPVEASAPAAETPVESVANDAAQAAEPVEPVAVEAIPAAEPVEPVAVEAIPAAEPVATEAVETEPMVVESAPVVAEPASAQPVEVTPAPIPAPVAAPAARPQPEWMLHMAPLRAPPR